jgi:hypothetical protein
VRYAIACVKDEESPTSDKESNVSYPHAHCNRRNELVFIPNGDASGTQEHLYRKNGRIKAVIGTYIRSTIKREAAIKARKANACKGEKMKLSWRLERISGRTYELEIGLGLAS